MRAKSLIDRYRLFPAMLIAVSAFVMPLGAQAAFIRVTDFVDDTDTSSGTCTLREAIRAANSNLPVDACPAGSSTQVDRISVDAGTHFVDLTGDLSDPNKDLEITEAVVLEGASADYSIVEALPNAINRMLEIKHNSGTVTIRRIAFRGGDATVNGLSGGVLRNGPTGSGATKLIEVDLSGGKSAIGGGLFNTGELAIERSRIFDNQVIDLPIEGGNHGGGIFTAGSAADLVIIDSEIFANQAHRGGGGIYYHSGQFEIARSKISDNIAGTIGGGMAVQSDQLIAEYLEVARNQAVDGGGMYLDAAVEVQRSAFVENTASAAGGALHVGADAFVRFSTITGNSAQFGAGVYSDSNQTLLDSNTIARNLGVGIHNVSGVFFENTLVAENSIGNCGGAPAAFGAYNMDDGNTCGFVPGPQTPNYPNTDPMLDVLRENGGPTPTLALLPGSPAIDVVSTEIRMNCEKMVDQRAYHRGLPRTQNANDEDVFWCDIGAYEAVQPFVVNSLVDDVDADLQDDLCLTAAGKCTLRAAIQQANEIKGMVEVSVGAGVHALTIVGDDESEAVTGDLDAHHPITITGAGAALTTIDGNGLDRVFDLGMPEGELIEFSYRPQAAIIRDLRITGGDSGAENGGGILARRALRVERMNLSNNLSGRGSAIATNRTSSFSLASSHLVEVFGSTVTQNSGALPLYLANGHVENSSLIDNIPTIFRNGGAGEFIRVVMRNSTVSGNHQSATGAFFAGSAIIENSTIYNNTADFESGGVFLLDHSVIQNSIIANNRGEGGAIDNCSFNQLGITSFGHNITDTDSTDCDLTHPTDLTQTDPELGPLSLSLGETATHEPDPGSLAIDSGDDFACPAWDQRGLPRPLDGDNDGNAHCDIGAVEVPEPGFGIGLIAGALILLGRARRSANIL